MSVAFATFSSTCTEPEKLRLSGSSLSFTSWNVGLTSWPRRTSGASSARVAAGNAESRHTAAAARRVQSSERRKGASVEPDVEPDGEPDVEPGLEPIIEPPGGWARGVGTGGQ